MVIVGLLYPGFDMVCEVGIRMSMTFLSRGALDLQV